jgi:hypothetical protein
MDLHEGPVARLLEGIERQEPQGGLDHGVERARGALVLEARGEDADSKLVQAFALAREPALERGFLHRQPRQELAPVQRAGPGERLRAACLRELLEGDRIHLESRRAQLDALVVGPQQARTVGSQGSADIEQRLPQAVPRLLFAPLGPEQGGELCAGAGVPARQGQEGQERLRLAAEREGAGAEGGLEAAKQGQGKLSHGVRAAQGGANDISTRGR